MLSVVTTDNPARIYTAGGTILAVTEDGAQGGGDAPYFTQGQSDARYALKAWTPKSAAYTLLAGDQILADTSAGAVTLTLPAAPNIGDAVAIQDAKDSFATHNLSVDPGSNDIESAGGVASYSTNSLRLYFVWVGGSIGWRVVTIGAGGASIGNSLVLSTSEIEGDLTVSRILPLGPASSTRNSCSSGRRPAWAAVRRLSTSEAATARRIILKCASSIRRMASTWSSILTSAARGLR